MATVSYPPEYDTYLAPGNGRRPHVVTPPGRAFGDAGVGAMSGTPLLWLLFMRQFRVM